jgi:outer membrane protein
MNFRFSVLGLLLGSMAFASNVKVGTVDINKALRETKRGLSATASLEKEQADKEKSLKAEKDKLDKLVADFQKKSAVMSEQARNKEGMELQKKVAGFQDQYQKINMDLKAREFELKKPIIDGLRSEVQSLAKDNKVEMVFESNSTGPQGVDFPVLLYAQDRIDLTNELIKVYDKKNP